ncbi:MAG: SDR family oxidoreductase [Deltaproteobacteria bacterium]|nr:SDR family oxidoreductase [Deltaproteobacteria bacterium]
MFEDRVAIVTGAGGGLGKSHALMLASHGAKVVVNDLGAALDGSGEPSKVADQVVEEIKAAGGEAVANYDGVDSAEGAERIVQTALDTFGRVDIVVNNAGILRDGSFAKMSLENWDAVLRVHLSGTMNVSRAAWPRFREAKFGRIINTTSAAGLYGNFGQANYSAAKMGIVGFTQTLAQEGAKYDIKTNAIAPVAKSRMTETILPPEVLAKLEPELVSPLVLRLAAADCPASGRVYAVGGGYIARVAVMEAKGANLGQKFGVDDLIERWAEIEDMSGARAFGNAMEAVGEALKQT